MRKLMFLVLFSWSFSCFSQVLSVTAKVTYFERDASYSHYFDGSFEVAHISKYTIQSPLNFQGKEVVFYHWSKHPELEAKLSPGTNVTFNIKDTILSDIINNTSSQASFNFVAATFKVRRN